MYRYVKTLIAAFDQYLNRFLTKPFEFHTFEYFIIFGNRLTGSSPLFPAQRIKLSSSSFGLVHSQFEWQRLLRIDTATECVRVSQ